MAERISPSELKLIQKSKRRKSLKMCTSPSAAVNVAQRPLDGEDNQQQLLYWDDGKESCSDWVESKMSEMRFSFSSSSPNLMEEDTPWGVTEWSPELEDDAQDMKDMDQCYPRQLATDESDDYSREFYHWNMDLEKKYHPRQSLNNQPEVRPDNRVALIAWLSRVTRSYEFYQETLFLAVNFIDRFLCLTPIALECFQLLGIAALFLAAKQLEVYHPTITELLTLCSGMYSRQHLQQMEKIILRQLKFQLVVPTCLFFLEYYTCNIQSNSAESGAAMFKKRPFRQMACNLSELCIQDYRLCQYSPSVMAISSMAVVEEYTNGRPTDLFGDGRCLETLTLSVIKECTMDIWRYVARAMSARPLSDLAREDFFEQLDTVPIT